MLLPHSAAVPKSIEEWEALIPPLKALLYGIPEVWVERDLNTMSALEQNAMFLLIASGLMEEWACFRLKLPSEDYSLEVEAKFTGSGIENVLSQVLPSIYVEKQKELDAIKAATNSFGLVREDIGPAKYRLTKDGVAMRLRSKAAEASSDIEHRTNFVCDFHGRVVSLAPGYGLLVRAEKTAETTAKRPLPVEVTNWPKAERENPPPPQFTDWLPPDSWRKWLRENSRASSPTKWLEFKRAHGGEDHPQSGSRLVRFPAQRLLDDGLQPPDSAATR